MAYEMSALQQVQNFLLARPDQPWCSPCLERELGRRVHASPVLLEGYPRFRRTYEPCAGCGQVRLTAKYTA
jgi:hypothetical protein